VNHVFYGITQNLETKNYMVVLNNKCKECNEICYAKCFQLNFLNWTSGNKDIDEFIQDTQSSAHSNVEKVLEWIPNNRFHNIEYITTNRYIANWIDGYIIDWNSKNQNWEREGQNMSVNMRSIELKNITLEFINEVY
jgi:hypothetical protein